VIVETDIRRLYIPVDDPLAVSIGQRLGKLSNDLRRSMDPK
jgi:hypothetical protein